MIRSPSALLARRKLARPRFDIYLPQNFAIADIVTGGCGADNSGVRKIPWNGGTLRKNRRPVAPMTQHLPQRSKADSIACRENRCLLPPGLRTQRYRRAVTPPRFTEIR